MITSDLECPWHDYFMIWSYDDTDADLKTSLHFVPLYTCTCILRLIANFFLIFWEEIADPISWQNFVQVSMELCNSEVLGSHYLLYLRTHLWSFAHQEKNKFPVKVIHLRDFLNTLAGMPYEGVWALPQLIDNNNKNILETLSGISPPEQKEWTSHASGETRENGGTKLTTL